MKQYLLPTVGWRNILRVEPLLLALPAPFFVLAVSSLLFLPIPIILYWAIGVIWLDYGKGD